MSVAAATVGSPTESVFGTRFTQAGDRWWDGEGWQCTVSADGSWRWDGSQWRPTAGLVASLRHFARRTLPVTIRLAILAAIHRPLRRSALSRRYRRERLQVEIIKQLTGTRVVTGPFSGMRYIERAVASEYAPKLLGTYELELHPVMEQIVNRGYETVIDIGAAEGYYVIGLASRLRTARIIAFECRLRAHALLRHFSALNGLDGRIELLGRCTPALLEQSIPRHGKTLVICDVEGGEDSLMRPEEVSGLRRADVLVELHDFAVPGVSAEIWRRFQATHRIQYIPTRPRSEADWPLNLTTPGLPELSLMSEGRPTPMHWFWMSAQPGAHAGAERL